MFTVVLSVFSAILATVACGISYLTYQRLKIRDIRDDSDRFLQRNNTFEAKLGDWEEALALHGIDTAEAKNEGISFRQIAYLILVANAITTYAQHRGTTPYNILAEREYSRMLFSGTLTQKTWRYAKHCISDPTRTDVDKYIEELDRTSVHF